MLKVQKEIKGESLFIRMVGSIEENVDFASMVGTITTPRIDLNLKEVPRINSVGIKAWIRYFQDITSKGVHLTLHECSTAIVEQMNRIANFTCGATVETLFLPFCCVSCNTELLGLFRATDLKKKLYKVPELKCSKCGGVAKFDDVPEEYFIFLERK